MVRPGDRLGERYVVIEQLAAGGMGTLWRAHHVELDVDVALKVVSARAATPASLKRFKHEAQAAAKLRSPNIVQVLDYGEFDGQPYLAMELLKGDDLATHIARAGKLDAERCAKVLDGMAKAVELAHGSGIIHRDLKPGNVFIEKIGEDEVVKVLDFGIAKDLGAAPDPGSTTGAGVVGSPAYMSPEQVWNKKVGFRADVWAMGVVAFEMLTGKNPFLDETLAKIFERIIRDPLPKVRDHDPALPESLEAFFERALARTASERFGSARELAQAFHAAIEGRELPPRPSFDPHAPTEQALKLPAAVETVRRRDRAGGGKRGPVVIALVAVALVGGVALLGASRAARPVESPREPNELVREEPPAPVAPLAPTTATTSERDDGRATAIANVAASGEPALPRKEPKPSASPGRAPKLADRESARSVPRDAPSSSTTAVPTAPSARDPRFGIPVNP